MGARGGTPPTTISTTQHLTSKQKNKNECYTLKKIIDTFSKENPNIHEKKRAVIIQIVAFIVALTFNYKRRANAILSKEMSIIL